MSGSHTGCSPVPAALALLGTLAISGALALSGTLALSSSLTLSGTRWHPGRCYTVTRLDSLVFPEALEHSYLPLRGETGVGCLGQPALLEPARIAVPPSLSGDTDKAICSRASYHLLQLLQAHPAMKAVIVREVRALVFRPGGPGPGPRDAAGAGAGGSEPRGHVHTYIRFADEDAQGDGAGGEGAAMRRARGADGNARGKGAPGTRAGGPATMARWNAHAWYYAAVTLNQVVLSPAEADRAVARTLVGVYFEMFEEVLGAKRRGEVSEEAAGSGGEGGGHGDGEAKAKGKNGGREKGERKGKGRRPAGAKEVRGAAGFAEVEDATSRLLGAVLTGVNRALPFAKLDVAGDETFKAHIDTLFLITHTSTFNISLQALLLVLQITTSLSAHHPSQPSTSAAPASSFATALTDRFYRTLYASLADARLAESNKQAMYLNLLFKALKADRNVERVAAFVRRFVQVLAVGVGGGGGAEFVAGGLYLLGELFQSIPELKTLLGGKGKRGVVPVEGEDYDPLKRDPQYAHASATPMYELMPLLHHYHPTVSLHARQLLNSEPITASPDLALNTLSHFLDRFVYKNPKKPRTRGPSAMQPAASAQDGAGGVKMSRGEVADDGLRVNEENWWKRKAEDVPADQVFFHRYFTKKKEREDEKAAKVGKRRGREDESDESDGDEGASDDGELSASDVEPSAEVEDDVEGPDSDAMKATMPAELQDDDLMEDSEDEDDIPSGLDEDSEDENISLSDKESANEDEPEEEEDDGSDAFSLVEGSDAEDLLSLDADVDVPGGIGLIEYDGSVASDDAGEWSGFGAEGDAQSKKGKRKREQDGAKDRRKKLKSLPTFASYEDYARMIEDGPEDNL
ncbi:hypothetical protein POSPLADRAFT_1065929 [Postia placenta MAD-698-R-SB12]|uniref:CCAAT-binding factor domain-containing protein n=1 Tax=Postia placenta MAD-698-R-SB12 TaxID=670580 RepID=A0A1X6N349_9APHY|nr:hypothetical protein POSPLADRAFT_1065929 [Postia placenta MAD-698-R-SB12]OSX62863.1 hypothetical protein POSPLADRAFT_1065929 [Postia placenta MAD-698-R-SB12]